MPRLNSAAPIPTSVLLAAFCLLQLALFAVIGVQMAGDSELYLEGARRMLSHIPLEGRQLSYAGYVSVIAIAQSAGIGLAWVVAAQIAVATIAAAAVYRIGRALAGTRAGAVAVLLFAADVETGRWHRYILADSLYLSTLAIAAWLVYAASSRDSHWRARIIALVVLAACASVRPEGWFVIPAALAYWIFRDTQSASWHWSKVAIVALAAAGLVVVASNSLSPSIGPVGPGEMLRRGETIWNFDGWRVAMPAAPPFGDGSAGVRNALGYALSHPMSTLTLMLARVVVCLVHVRPYYATWHNIVIALWIIPVYALAAYGGWTMRRHSVVRWCLLVIATQLFVVSLTHAESDGRYLAHVLALVYPMTAAGVVRLIDPSDSHATAAGLPEPIH